MTNDPLADRVLELVRDAALAGQACPTNHALSLATGFGMRAVRDALARVERAGLIRVKRGVRARVVEDAAGAWRTRGELIEVRPGVLSGTWTTERDARLRMLAARGDSYTEIAAAMGLSRNSVIGRAHRLGLPARPSQIITLPPPGASPGPVNRGAPSDPAVGSGHIQPAEVRGPLAAVPSRVAPSASAPASGHLLSARTRQASSPYRTCQWIAGEPAGDRTLFCGDPVTTRLDGGRSSYCAEHHARCWRPSLRQLPALGRAA